MCLKTKSFFYFNYLYLFFASWSSAFICVGIEKSNIVIPSRPFESCISFIFLYKGDIAHVMLTWTQCTFAWSAYLLTLCNLQTLTFYLPTVFAFDYYPKFTHSTCTLHMARSTLSRTHACAFMHTYDYTHSLIFFFFLSLYVFSSYYLF